MMPQITSTADHIGSWETEELHSKRYVNSLFTHLVRWEYQTSMVNVPKCGYERRWWMASFWSAGFTVGKLAFGGDFFPRLSVGVTWLFRWTVSMDFRLIFCSNGPRCHCGHF